MPWRLRRPALGLAILVDDERFRTGWQHLQRLQELDHRSLFVLRKVSNAKTRVLVRIGRDAARDQVALERFALRPETTHRVDRS